jgi:hypothetical protein
MNMKNTETYKPACLDCNKSYVGQTDHYNTLHIKSIQAPVASRTIKKFQNTQPALLNHIHRYEKMEPDDKNRFGGWKSIAVNTKENF